MHELRGRHSSFKLLSSDTQFQYYTAGVTKRDNACIDSNVKIFSDYPRYRKKNVFSHLMYTCMGHLSTHAHCHCLLADKDKMTGN